MKIKDIKREKTILIISAILKSIFVIVMGYIIATKFVVNEKRIIKEENGLITDINPIIKRKLDIIDNNNIKNVKNNKVIVTNNSGNSFKYQIIISPINDNENNIIVNFNNTIENTLNKFKKEDNYYILYEGQLDYKYSSILDIKLYTKVNKNIKVNFKLEVKRI